MRSRAAAIAAAAEGRAGAGRSHGKAILLGEHAVVYGAPALALPLPQLPVTATATVVRDSGAGQDEISIAIARPGNESPVPLPLEYQRHLVSTFKRSTEVTHRLRVEVLIECLVPPGRGLGSSAAYARASILALAGACDRRLDDESVFELVQASETLVHGRASGIDARATAATAPIYFTSGTARELPVAMAGTGHRPDGDDAGAFHAVFVIADSGVDGSTKEAVSLVRQRFERVPGVRESFVHGVSELTRAALDHLLRGRVDDFGTCMTENQRLLRDVGVSTDRIDALVRAARAGGAAGAKLSGGGLGGCVIAVADGPARSVAVAQHLRAAGAEHIWTVRTGRFAGCDH
ncbi:mevalonate kinase [Micromonospora sp. NPDC049102]|uniref:mevalonate kinase n=1 Tax=Micromonospora sp. NPDC049102 TaxID=3364265 RepID=UPI00371A234C